MLLNYHISRFVPSSLCIGNLAWLGLSSARVAGFSLKHCRSLAGIVVSNTAGGMEVSCE